jgi:hypothetical protein
MQRLSGNNKSLLILMVLLLTLLSGCFGEKIGVSGKLPNSDIPVTVQINTPSLPTSEPISNTPVLLPTPKNTILTDPVLPPLFRPLIDDYVILTHPFYIGEAPNYDPDKNKNTYLPLGSIVYRWDNGITEAFGSNGDRILITKDSECTKITVPAGASVPVTRVFSPPDQAIPNYEEYSTVNITKFRLKSAVVFTIIESKESYQRQ